MKAVLSFFGMELTVGIPHLERFATSPEIWSVNKSRGIFQSTGHYCTAEAHTRRRWSRRALGRRLGESCEQGWRPRLFSTGYFRGEALAVSQLSVSLGRETRSETFLTRETFGGLGEAWVPCALCTVLEKDWLSGLSEILGGGGIHFPTPTARPVATPAIACHCLPLPACHSHRASSAMPSGDPAVERYSR